EARLVGRTIRSLHDAARAAGRRFEIIVADDASTDGTAGVAREHGARVVRIDRRQIAAARNAGARAARGDALVFVDADTVLPATTLRAALRALESGVVAGGAAIRFDGRVPHLAHSVFSLLGEFLCRSFGFAPGCFVFCTRAAFEAAGGFDEGYFAGEEVWLSRKLRRQGRFVILSTPVVTSGRKVRAYSGWEILALFARQLWMGRDGGRSRDGLEIFYGPRRPDPGEHSR
ncbi:MAG: glycosyltransferase, partial [Planctomycetota bacterium]